MLYPIVKGGSIIYIKEKKVCGICGKSGEFWIFFPYEVWVSTNFRHLVVPVSGWENIYGNGKYFPQIPPQGVSSDEVSQNNSCEAEAVRGVVGWDGSIIISLSSTRFFNVILVSINLIYRV